MIKKKNYDEYIGNEYNLLTILDIYKIGKQRKAFCKCQCGNKKEMNFYNVIKGKSKSCGCYEKESRYNRNHAQTDIIGKRFGKLTVIKDSGNRSANGSVIWECKCDCGNITYCESSNLKRGHKQSCGCNKLDYINSLKNNIIGKKFGLLTAIKELDRSQYDRRTYTCECDCGNICIVDGSSLTTGHTTSCGCMGRSKGEYIIQEILQNHNISFINQYRFDDCKHERRLPFDFYLPENNVCIEYQGKQHYQVVDYFGGVQGFEDRKRNDSIKRRYCKDNDIVLLEIQYGETIENIEKIILNVLNP